MQEDSNMKNRNSAFCMQFAYKLCSSPVALLAAALKFSAIIFVKNLTLIDFEIFKNRPQILLLWSLQFGIETGSVLVLERESH